MIRLITIIFILLLCNSEVFAKSPPPGTGADDVPANILIMLDTSGSMNTTITMGDSQYPIDFDFDSAGNIYVAKYYDVVEKYDSSGQFLLQWGGYTSPPTNGSFDLISSIAVDSQDYVYVTDRINARVQKFDSSGNFIWAASLSSTPAQGIAIDSSDNVYVLNGIGKIEKFSSSGTLLASWNNNNGGRSVAIDSSNNVYITRFSARRVEKYNSSGTLLSSFATTFRPHGIEIDQNGDLYVSARNDDKVHKLSPTGTVLASWGNSGTNPGEFQQPTGITMRSDNTIFVADYLNHRIQTVTGTMLTVPNASSQTRMDIAKNVIKAIVSNSNLTDGANFGLMSWSSNATMTVNVSPTGASTIFNTVDSLTPAGGTVLDNAMNLAQTYFLGASSPMDPSLSCQENILIVVSDGFWTDTTASATAASLYASHGIRTFTVGFLTTGNSNYVTLSQAGGTYPDSPLYASNEAELLNVLSNYIQQIISSSLTFTAPTIIPSAANDESIIQSTFTYKREHQWKGRLLKYALLADGNVGSLLWDAGALLNQVQADNRNIWTVATALPNGLNNFEIAELDRLRQPLEEYSGITYTDTELTNLIEFIRGKDTYDEFANDLDDEGEALLAGERWKLADIYHSRSAIVGKPSAYFSDASRVNTESYYRYLNNYAGFISSSQCGTVCSNRKEMIYVGSNGGKLHAFNSTTGAEEWAFIPPSLLGSLKDVISANANESNSIYGVDGTPTVKDIFYSGQWRTILMAGLRQGGQSYFALDITDPDNPQHMFTIASRPLNQLVSYWDANGTRTNYSTASSVPAAFDFSKLGESWSQPVIVKLKINSVDKWVALIAGGYNNAINPNYGANLYILDLENGGQIIQRIDLADNDATNGIVNSVPPRITVITADSTTLFQDAGAMVYVNDLEGKLWQINLTDQGTLYEKSIVFNAQSTDTNGRHMFHELSASIASGSQHLMLFYGSGNMQQLGAVSASIQNRAYGILEPNFPGYANNITIDTSGLLDTTSGASCPSAGQRGWYINLDPNEKITAKTSVGNETVFLSRYTPNASAQCSPGTAKLTEVNFMCGNSIRTTDLGSGVPTEAIIYENKVYIGVSDDGSGGVLPPGFIKSGNLIVGDPAVVMDGEVRLEGWREDF